MARTRTKLWAGMTEENDWRYTALLVDGREYDVARALVEAGSRSAGRRRGGAAAGQSGRALRAGPVRDKEGRSKLSSLTMDSPAVQIPRAARRSTCSLEEARWWSAGAAVAVQSRRQKSCELPCRSSRERACVDSTRTRVARRTKATLRGLFHSFAGVFRDCQRYRVCETRTLQVFGPSYSCAVKTYIRKEQRFAG